MTSSTSSINEIPMFEDIFETLSNDSHAMVRVHCVYKLSEKCQGEYIKEFYEIFRNYKRNNQVYICPFCIQIKKHTINYSSSYNLNDKFLSVIDSEHKAYLLGLVASRNGFVEKEIIQIKIHENDLEVLKLLRDFVCPNIPIKELNNDIFSLDIISNQMSEDICKHLGISLYDQKDSVVQFPYLEDKQLKWDFIRGYFDGNGNIFPRKSGYPRCCISSNSLNILNYIQNFCSVTSHIYQDKIEWNGINTVDFLAKLYEDASIYKLGNYTLFLSIANWQPIIKSEIFLNSIPTRLPSFRWSRTILNAPGPQKNRFSDSGYDLHLVKKVKTKGNVHYYDTGIQIQPENGYYFDLVGRSSISKSGWTLANNIGIIDNSYTGSILVALIRTDPEAQEPILPCKLVQIIPRQLILMLGEEVNSLEDTDRGTGGFGSTDSNIHRNKFK